ncbi:hypothetical protein [Pseudomonas alabamensis]|uniref:hypothetical protein n=1 Tax=Pseudomonas alabamensis TaxID=3064349 RepID=UPI003F6496B6
MKPLKSESESAKPYVNHADHLRLHTTRFFLVPKYRTPSRKKNSGMHAGNIPNTDNTTKNMGLISGKN